MRREGEANCSESVSSTSHCCGVQRPPAEILVGPQGGLQTLIFFDDLPPQVWEISGDLPGYQP